MFEKHNARCRGRRRNRHLHRVYLQGDDLCGRLREMSVEYLVYNVTGHVHKYRDEVGVGDEEESDEFVHGEFLISDPFPLTTVHFSRTRVALDSVRCGKVCEVRLATYRAL